MLDKFTYGSTPAAIYLVDQLNELKDPKLNRKVTRLLTSFNEVINELITANRAGLLSAHTVGTFIAMLRQRAQTASKNFEDQHFPSLIADLTTNVMTGKVKELQRKVITVRHWEQTLARTFPDGNYPLGYSLSSVVDPITPDTLTDRSKKRMARKGKKSFL